MSKLAAVPVNTAPYRTGRALRDTLRVDRVLVVEGVDKIRWFVSSDLALAQEGPHGFVQKMDSAERFEGLVQFVHDDELFSAGKIEEVIKRFGLENGSAVGKDNDPVAQVAAAHVDEITQDVPPAHACPICGSLMKWWASECEFRCPNCGHQVAPPRVVPLRVIQSGPPTNYGTEAEAEAAWTEALKGLPPAAPPASCPEGYAQRVLETVVARGSDYGHPTDNHQLTADLWTAWLRRRLGLEQLLLTAEDVCMLNILQKQSRLAFATKDDSWLDIAGYTENVSMLKLDQRNFAAPGPG